MNIRLPRLNHHFLLICQAAATPASCGNLLLKPKKNLTMSKRNRSSGSREIERRLAEGRGMGRGRHYLPWIEIHDVPSRGLSTRMKSSLTGRTHHLLSQLETDWLFAFHAMNNLVDVREQFPLLTVEETLEIANQLRVAHQVDPKSKEPIVGTTDFLLTLRDGPREVNMAIAIKPSSDLASPRVLEKLEIERVYWAARKTDWRILTEQELPRAVVKNLRWVQPHIDLPESGAFAVHELDRIRTSMESAVRGGGQSLAELTIKCDDRLGLTPGASLCVVRHLIAAQLWLVDLTVEIDPRKPLQLIEKYEHPTDAKLAA